MSLFDDHPLTALDRKAHAALGDKVVVKSLAAAAGFHRLPRYVSEYLLAKYVRPDTLAGRPGGRAGQDPRPLARPGAAGAAQGEAARPRRGDPHRRRRSPGGPAWRPAVGPGAGPERQPGAGAGRPHRAAPRPPARRAVGHGPGAVRPGGESVGPERAGRLHPVPGRPARPGRLPRRPRPVHGRRVGRPACSRAAGTRPGRSPTAAPGCCCWPGCCRWSSGTST